MPAYGDAPSRLSTGRRLVGLRLPSRVGRREGFEAGDTSVGEEGSGLRVPEAAEALGFSA